MDEANVQNKRKREIGVMKPAKKRAMESESAMDVQSQVLHLEEKIRRSRKDYNNISILLEYARTERDGQIAIAAIEALYRVFRRLMAAGNLSKSQETTDNEAIIVQWLKERYQEYIKILLQIFANPDEFAQSTALTLALQLVKGETGCLPSSDVSVWRTGLFTKIVRTLLADETSDATREDFAKKYLGIYDDIQYYTLEYLAGILPSESSGSFIQNIISLLTAIQKIPEHQSELGRFFVDSTHKIKHNLRSLTARKRQAQQAWMGVLKNTLSKSQRKIVLKYLPHRIAPWFLKIELLMDFLTDSFDSGGETTLLALSGLFYLIQNKNLDYPHFYQKLYSLLDSGILHSQHRSRFFRLLDTCLASTHLPAALVASFIKRLSRLTLDAPPAAIVFVVPWMYNLLRNHPSCTFMIHRNSELDQDGNRWGDPFLMEEPDPMETDALESSLWEIHTLQTHYHPNVATIAKIISAQFTKQAYNLEDFWDHSYGSMLDAELSKDVKNPPEIEYEIPKRIFRKQDPGDEPRKTDGLLVSLWDFS